MLMRGFLLLFLLLGLMVLGPLAYAIPPDPTWIAGLYDDADHDDVVLIATDLAATLGLSPITVTRRVPLTIRVAHATESAGSGATVLASPGRAPPIR